VQLRHVSYHQKWHSQNNLFACFHFVMKYGIINCGVNLSYSKNRFNLRIKKKIVRIMVGKEPRN
jgi:hypothetical protein